MFSSFNLRLYTLQMMRELMLVFLMLCLSWSSAASAGAGISEFGVQGVQHSAMHAQDSTHHHHEDGSLHADEAPNSAFHAHVEGAGNAPAMLSVHRLVFVARTSCSPAVATLLPFASLTPKVPMRPPRAGALSRA